MIRPERNDVIRTTLCATAGLFIQQRADQSDHIGVTVQMGSLFETAVRKLGDVAQMGEMEAIRDAARDSKYIIARIGPQ